MAQIVTITNPLTGQPAQVDQLEHTAQQIDDGIGFESTDYSGCYYRMVGGVVEWLNPPLQLGQEYRTTERYLGKPVYAKAVSGGAITADSKKAVSVSDVGESVVDACVIAKLSNGTVVRLPYTDSFGGTSGEVFSSVQSGIVYVSYTLHGINATESTAIAKYTKTTD